MNQNEPAKTPLANSPAPGWVTKLVVARTVKLCCRMTGTDAPAKTPIAISREPGWVTILLIASFMELCCRMFHTARTVGQFFCRF